MAFFTQKVLREAGVTLLRKNGKSIASCTSGNSMICTLSDGEEIRVRTCNFHLLIITADQPSPYAHLDIDGTEWLLIVMPEVENSAGRIIGYLVPTKEVKCRMIQSHKAWLQTNPNTKGKNKTWTLGFNRYSGKGKDEHKELGYDFFTKWAEYRLKGEVWSKKSS